MTHGGGEQAHDDVVGDERFVYPPNRDLDAGEEIGLDPNEKSQGVLSGLSGTHGGALGAVQGYAGPAFTWMSVKSGHASTPGGGCDGQPFIFSTSIKIPVLTPEKSRFDALKRELLERGFWRSWPTPPRTRPRRPREGSRSGSSTPLDGVFCRAMVVPGRTSPARPPYEPLWDAIRTSFDPSFDRFLQSGSSGVCPSAVMTLDARCRSPSSPPAKRSSQLFVFGMMGVFHGLDRVLEGVGRGFRWRSPVHWRPKRGSTRDSRRSRSNLFVLKETSHRRRWRPFSSRSRWRSPHKGQILLKTSLRDPLWRGFDAP